MIDEVNKLTGLGLHLFPLKTKSKHPATSHGFKDSSSDPAVIAAWWVENPDYNIGVDCGASGITVLDIDAGLNSVEDLAKWFESTGLPSTYTVRTGRRTSYGVQMYWLGTMPSSGAKKWSLNGCTGEIKSIGGYVVGAGSIHPDSGKKYKVILDVPFHPLPDLVRDSVTNKKEEPKREPSSGKIPPGNWHNLLVSFAGTVFNAGITTPDGLFKALLAYAYDNFDCTNVPLDKSKVAAIAKSAAESFEQTKPIEEVLEEMGVEECASIVSDLGLTEEVADSNEPESNKLRYPELVFPLDAVCRPGTLLRELTEAACRGGEFCDFKPWVLDPGFIVPAILTYVSGLPEEHRMLDVRVNLFTILLAMSRAGKGTSWTRAAKVLELGETGEGYWMDYDPGGHAVMVILLADQVLPHEKGQPVITIPGPKKMVCITNELSGVIKSARGEASRMFERFNDFYDKNVFKQPEKNSHRMATMNCRVSWGTSLAVGIDKIDETRFTKVFGNVTNDGFAARMNYGFSEKAVEPREIKQWRMLEELSIYKSGDEMDSLIPYPARVKNLIVTEYAPEVKEAFRNFDLGGDSYPNDVWHMDKIMLLIALANLHTTVTMDDYNAAESYIRWQAQIRKIFSPSRAGDSAQAHFQELIIKNIRRQDAKMSAKPWQERWVNIQRLSQQNSWAFEDTSIGLERTVYSLYNCGELGLEQARDNDGNPRFHKDGNPIMNWKKVRATHVIDSPCWCGSVHRRKDEQRSTN